METEDTLIEILSHLNIKDLENIAEMSTKINNILKLRAFWYQYFTLRHMILPNINYDNINQWIKLYYNILADDLMDKIKIGKIISIDNIENNTLIMSVMDKVNINKFNINKFNNNLFLLEIFPFDEAERDRIIYFSKFQEEFPYIKLKIRYLKHINSNFLDIIFYKGNYSNSKAFYISSDKAKKLILLFLMNYNVNFNDHEF
jgi:hypothetical protein